MPKTGPAQSNRGTNFAAELSEHQSKQHSRVAREVIVTHAMVALRGLDELQNCSAQAKTHTNRSVKPNRGLPTNHAECTERNQTMRQRATISRGKCYKYARCTIDGVFGVLRGLDNRGFRVATHFGLLQVSLCACLSHHEFARDRFDASGAAAQHSKQQTKHNQRNATGGGYVMP